MSTFTHYSIVRWEKSCKSHAEKKQKQRLRTSQEKKDAQWEKERIIKNAKHHMETQAECDKHRKINRDSMMRKRQTETDKQGAKHKMTMQECVSKQ